MDTAPRRRRGRLASLLPGLLLLTVLGTGASGTLQSNDRSSDPVVQLEVRSGH
ncbi:MAG: hypothetical protein JWM64_1252 [Frankiales bacterium]|nr:hypothetical protein [Frankiales bacterium]